MIDAAKKGKRKISAVQHDEADIHRKGGMAGEILPKYEQVSITITWYEPNEKRDPDNVMAGQKFILDGLVKPELYQMTLGAT